MTRESAAEILRVKLLSSPQHRQAPGQELFPLATVSGGRYCAMGGGAPVTSEGEVVAGVGVSGGTVGQDVAILEAALQKA